MNHIATIKFNVLVLNAIAAATALVLYILFFNMLWHVQVPEKTLDMITLAVLGIGLVIVHEGIHGAVALLFVDRRKIRFGLTWFVVVCKVNGLMRRDQYILYSLAPAITLAFCGVLLYYLVDDTNAKFLSALLFLGGASSGGGDFSFAAKALKYPADSLFLDNGIEVDVFLTEPHDNETGRSQN